MLPEQVDGNIEEIGPHPGFRVFFTMDPKNGSLSRAMKNRCVEFCINEESSWFGDFESALNVMLFKEPLMCSTFEGQWETELDFELLKNCLRTAARSNISFENRLAELQNVLLLTTPSSDTIKTDKVSFKVLTSTSWDTEDRNPPSLLSGDRQLRLPFAEHPLLKSEAYTGITPDVLFSELQVEAFHRMAECMKVEADDNVNVKEYELAIMCLSILSTAPECLTNNNVFWKHFVNIDEGIKEALIDIIRDIFRKPHFYKFSSSPWDLRVFDNYLFDYRADENIDRFVPF